MSSLMISVCPKAPRYVCRSVIGPAGAAIGQQELEVAVKARDERVGIERHRRGEIPAVFVRFVSGTSRARLDGRSPAKPAVTTGWAMSCAAPPDGMKSESTL